MATYDVGDPIRDTVTFHTTAVPPVNVDPTTVTVTIDPPGTGRVSYVYPDAHVVHDATGVFHVDFVLTASGRWNVTWTGTGALIASDTLNFLVS